MAKELEWIKASMVLATDDELNGRYGRVQIPVETLRDIANQMNEGGISVLYANHDPTQPIRIRDGRASVERSDDGVRWLLRLEAEVHRDDWDEWQSHLQAVGVAGGMSMTVSEPVDVPEGVLSIRLSGDAADFEDSELLDLASTTPAGVSVGTYRMYQFAADSEAIRLAIDFAVSTLAGVPSNMIASWLSQALSLLRRKGREEGQRAVLDVRLRLEPDGALEFEARVWADDDQQGAEALSGVLKELRRLRKV